MAIYDLPAETSLNLSSGGHTIIVYLAQELPYFIPMFLFSLFMIIFLGGMFRQQLKDGRSDPAAWFAVAGFITVGMTYLMNLVDGIVNLATMVIVVAISLIGAIWFFMSPDRQ